MVKFSDEIIDDVRRLAKLETEFRRFSYEIKWPENKQEQKEYLIKMIEKAGEAHELRRQILLNSRLINVLQVRDENVKKILNDIRKDKDKFYSVSFFKAVWSENNEGEGYIPLDLIDIVEKLMSEGELLDDFHSWFDLIRFNVREIKVGPIITVSDLPNNVKKYFSEIRSAFAFGLYRSSVILCRSLLEISFYNALKKKNRANPNQAIVVSINDYKNDTLVEMIRLARIHNIIDSRLKNIAHEVRVTGNKILHLKEDELQFAEDDALAVIWKTIEVLEHIYRR